VSTIKCYHSKGKSVRSRTVTGTSNQNIKSLGSATALESDLSRKRTSRMWFLTPIRIIFCRSGLGSNRSLSNVRFPTGIRGKFSEALTNTLEESWIAITRCLTHQILDDELPVLKQKVDSSQSWIPIAFLTDTGARVQRFQQTLATLHR
jgi:hypothetical protein